MPVKVYPSISDITTTTATRRLYTGACTTATSFTTPQTSSPVTRWEIRTATGWETPGWRKIKNDGGILPFTKWDRFHSHGQAQPAEREWCGSPTGNRNKWFGLYAGGEQLSAMNAGTLMAMVDPFDLEYLVQQAAASIYSSGWDAATFLAEVSQLRRMLSGISKSLMTMADLFDPRRTRGLNQLRDLANLYLQGRYGWRTLMYDIQDFYDVISTANERRTRYRQAKGITVSGSWNDYVESTSSGIIAGISTDVTWSGNLRGTVVADIDIPDFQFNPVTTGWEVVRLSFVVDWLLNVGQALEASSFLLKAKNHKAGGGYKFDFELLYANNLVGTTGSTVCHAQHGSASGTATVISRIPMSVSALPRMKLRLNEWKVLDLLALAGQKLLQRR